MTASDSLFDSRGRFSWSSYPLKITEIEGLWDVAMATNFGTTLAANGLLREITTWACRRMVCIQSTPTSVRRSLWIRI